VAVNKELSIALELDPQGFVSGAQKAEAAAGGFEKELADVAAAAKAVDTAMDGVDSAKLPELTQKAGEAKFRIQELERATEALTKAGGAIPTQLTSKITEYGQKAQEAAVKGETFKRSLAETTREAQGVASGFEKISVKGQGYGTVLTQLNNESNKLTSKLGQMGPLIGSVTAAFTAGFAIGKAIKENWDEVARSMDRLIPGSKKVADAVKGAGQTMIDKMAELATGVKNAGDEFDRTGAKVQSGLAKAARGKDALEGVGQALAAAVPQFLAYQQAQQAAADQTKAWEDALTRVGKIQGADYGKFVRDSAKALVDWYGSLDDANKALVENNSKVSEAIRQAKDFLETQGQLSKGLDSTTQAIKAQGDALVTWQQQVEATKAAANKRLDEDAQRFDQIAQDQLEMDAEDAAYAAREEAIEQADRYAAAQMKAAEADAFRTLTIQDQNEALRQMATYVGQLNGSMYEGIPSMERFFEYFDRFADSKLYGGYLNEIGNSMKDGTRSINEGIAALEELKLGLDKIGAMGGGWLGDVLTEISGLVTQLNRAADAAKQAKRDAMWDNSAEDQTGPAGEQRTVGFAAGRSSGGSLGRITAELNRTRNP
jgi:hypothetical protein